MKKLIMALIAGSAMSTAAFAVEPAATPKALSDSEMDLVTAGTRQHSAGNRQQSRSVTVVDNSGNTYNGGNVNFGSINVVPIGSNANTTNTNNQGGNGSVNGSFNR